VKLTGGMSSHCR